jgi:UDP-3-O-[3-hydroxymyristoyl] glucosamine N-acyltransferase
MVAPGAVIGSNVDIGKSCIIGMTASIFYELRIPDRTIVKNGESVFKTIGHDRQQRDDAYGVM